MNQKASSEKEKTEREKKFQLISESLMAVFFRLAHFFNFCKEKERQREKLLIFMKREKNEMKGKVFIKEI